MNSNPFMTASEMISAKQPTPLPITDKIPAALPCPNGELENLFAIFDKETARVLRDPENWTDESWHDWDSKWFCDSLNLIPIHILSQRKEFRKSIMIRNTYAEILNLLQADIMRKLKKSNLKNKKRETLLDAMFVTIAGISAAMKNTG